MRRFASILLLLSLLAVATVPAYATEDEALQPPPPVEEVSDTATVEPAPLSDTQGTETETGTERVGDVPQVPADGNDQNDILEKVIVSTQDELLTAIGVAQDGDTIYISQPIWIEGEEVNTVGALDKTITLSFEGIESCECMIYAGESNASFIFQNLIFDGYSESTHYDSLLLITQENQTVSLENILFLGRNQECKSVITSNLDSHTVSLSNVEINGFVCSEAPIVTKGNVELNYCTIKDNTGATSGGLYSKGVATVRETVFTKNSSKAGGGAIKGIQTLEVYESVFTENYAFGGGGAIYLIGNTKCTIQDTIISDNISENTSGGGIYAAYPVNITMTDCIIHSNDSDESGADLCLKGGMREILYTKDISEIYTETEEVPYGWISDTPFDRTSATMPIEYGTVFDLQEDTELTARFIFEDEIEVLTLPLDDTEDSTPSTDDTEDDTTPTPSYKPSYRPSTSTVTQVVEDTEIMPEATTPPPLTCGEAEIDMSRSVTLQGYEDGEIHEEDTLTRGQFSAILYRLLTDTTIEKYTEKNSVFSDVSAVDWYYEYINTIANAGIVFGTGNDQFSPNSTLTWAQVLTVLSRFVEVESYALENIPYDGWAKEAVETAVANNWITDDASIIPDAPITRGEIVTLINGVLEMYR